MAEVGHSVCGREWLPSCHSTSHLLRKDHVLQPHIIFPSMCSQAPHVELGSGRIRFVPYKSETSPARRQTDDFVGVGACKLHSTMAAPRMEIHEGLESMVDNLEVIDRHRYARLLHNCSSVYEGKEVHDRINKVGLNRDLYIGNLLIRMYGKYLSLENALSVFDDMPRKDVVTWNTMMSAYTQHGYSKDAVDIYNRMILEGFEPNKITFVTVLNACSASREHDKGKLIHSYIICKGRLNVIVGNALINMYGKCNSLEDACDIFEMMYELDAVSWNAIIFTYAQHGHANGALQLFKSMLLDDNLHPNEVTFAIVLRTCSDLGALEVGKLAHASIVKWNFRSSISTRNLLIKMYSTCGSLKNALSIFNEMQHTGLVAWTSMIGACAHCGEGERALKLFFQMLVDGCANPSKVTFITTIAACSRAELLAAGKVVHAMILDGGLEVDVLLGTALVNMYGRCGNVDEAYALFRKLPERNVVTWNALIGVYAQCGYSLWALQHFHKMHLDNIVPNKITYVTILDACASLAALSQGMQMHVKLYKRFEQDLMLQTSLVNMYGKCGRVEEARAVFDQMGTRNMVTCTAIIAAYAQHGYGKDALEVLKYMQQASLKPNSITFISILSACSHGGLGREGCHYFVSMSEMHGIVPVTEHYGCIVDLLGRAGQLDQAKDLIIKMPFKPNLVVWKTYLGACGIHGFLEEGRLAAEHVLALDSKDSEAYAVLSNIYAAEGRWSDVAKIKEAMIENGVKKEAGRSWIEINNTIHEFVAGGRSHPQIDLVHAEVERLRKAMKEEGYAPKTKAIFHGVVKHRDDVLCYHSEKLALAFGLISTPAGTPLRIIKNVRECPDCHNAAKFISKMVAREIVVRDAHRFHVIKDGVCSCRDYW